MTADVIGGRYELLDRLGVGCMGEAYRSRDRLSIDIVSLKLLQALSYLHRRGIVHRDLKSSNVLVTGRQVTVLDFGVAGLPESALAGTTGFIAPEVLRGGRPTPTSDFYAVGVMAYEILVPGHRHGSRPLPPHGPDMAQLERLGAVGQLVKTLLSP